MKKESGYQIIEITKDKSIKLSHNWQGDKMLVDLAQLKSLIDNHSSAALESYFDKLTHNDEQSLLL